uniref:Uncharacterized protein LOC111117823 n=1 Tax=Crassostrea virginica TaxID=6565 RepID=A0A8B8CAT8_CRAVI|nr:uncharacterized protein LOC111117823 [Crassostrea virginica]
MNTILKSAWQKCIQDFEAEKIQLPLLKIKLFDETPRIVRNHKLMQQIGAIDTIRFGFQNGPPHTDDLVDIVEQVEVDKETQGLRDVVSLLQDQSTSSQDELDENCHSPQDNFSQHQLPDVPSVLANEHHPRSQASCTITNPGDVPSVLANEHHPRSQASCTITNPGDVPSILANEHHPRSQASCTITNPGDVPSILANEHHPRSQASCTITNPGGKFIFMNSLNTCK